MCALSEVTPTRPELCFTYKCDKSNNMTKLYMFASEACSPSLALDLFVTYTSPFYPMLIGLGEMFIRPNLAQIADGPLLVSSVMHKSSMEMNEEGAEAAAATTVVISRASNPIFYLNQPFFLALMDDMTQVPIFMGVITNPNPSAPILQRGEFGSKDKVGFPSDKNYVRSFGGPPK